MGVEGQADRSPEEDRNKTFEMALETVEHVSEKRRWWKTEWEKYFFQGPAGAVALYESWSLLFKVSDYWREGALGKAIVLTIFSLALPFFVVHAAAFAYRKLRPMIVRWLEYRRLKND